MDQDQRTFEADGGVLMRHIIMSRWDKAFPSGYRMTTKPQFCRRYIAATTSNQDGSSFVGKITIPAQELTFFNYKAGDPLTDACATSITTDITDTSITSTPKQLDPGEEMVVESFDLIGGPLLQKYGTQPFGTTAGDMIHDSYGTMVAVEVASGRALQDVLLNAFLHRARLRYQYQDGTNGTVNLGPGCKGVGGLPHNRSGGRFPIVEGIYWASSNNMTGITSASESQLTVTLETKSPIYVMASFGSAARMPSNLSASVVCVANGINFSPAGRTN